MFRLKRNYNQLADKVAIITGSSRGIGRATAMMLCQYGAKVMLNGRHEERLKETYSALLAQGFKVAYYATDVTELESCRNLINATIARFGKIDIIIANASISMNARFDDISPEHFKKVLDSNLYGAIMPAFAGIDMLKSTEGSLVFISSIAGFYGLPNGSAYSIGKMGLTAFVQSLQAELRNSGVHIGIIYVGFTQNDEEKRVVSANGHFVPVAHRPRIMQQSQHQVAASIIKLILNRQRKATLSIIGKTFRVLSRMSPMLVSTIINWSQKGMREMYE